MNYYIESKHDKVWKSSKHELVGYLFGRERKWRTSPDLLTKLNFKTCSLGRTVWTLRNAVYDTFVCIWADMFIRQTCYRNICLYLCKNRCISLCQGWRLSWLCSSTLTSQSKDYDVMYVAVFCVNNIKMSKMHFDRDFMRCDAISCHILAPPICFGVSNHVLGSGWAGIKRRKCLQYEAMLTG